MGGFFGGETAGKRTESSSGGSQEREESKMVRQDEEEFKIIFKFKDEVRRAPNHLKLSLEIRDKIGEILNSLV